MARIARVVVPGLPHHVTQRGNHQQDVFFTDSDRELYLRLLREHCEKHFLRVWGYCLMTNHVHLLVVPERPDSMATALGRAHNEYSRWLHVRQRRTGHLWQNRFYSCVVDEGHQWETLRYVELNPVRAGMARRAWDWRWSSARAHCDPDPAGLLLDLSGWRQAYTAALWREALARGVSDANLAERLRQATRTGRPFGAEGFVELLEARLDRRLRPLPPGPKPAKNDGGLKVRSGVA